MTREPIEATRQDRIYCLKASSDYHRELCEECRFYPNCDHMTQDDLTELTIKDLEALEQEPTIRNDAVDVISREQALRELKESAEHHANDSREEALLRRDRDIIRALPSVAPQESILDKIRAEIENIDLLAEYTRGDIKRMALATIDKYKVKGEDEE